ncbi:long-chain fatty acid--CoA ligase [Thalassobius vesicularis]|uniref:Long-chain fatty acid--CoA ligase n=1 Tax=Thalassobius vesicularis TaxID=1294297 RepID=A0A4S3MA39_9RHOB|nr:class I adenylate-forming enzyme family protein [Thalassobius vesicularis]THD74847.1 long-chain fatty acid--CoA ligase [Thalassobius vesicularis]
MLSIFDRGAFAPCPTPFNFTAHVLARADDAPDKIALAVLSQTGSERWSYGRLKSAVLGTGTGLLARGFKPGDILLMRLGNTVDFPLAYLGAIAVGLVPVPTSSMLTAPEVQKMVDQLSPAGILHDPAVACPETTLPTVSSAELTAMRDLPPADYAMGDPNRLAYIIYTSGTSGQPRAVMHAHRAIWARQMMHEGWYGLGVDDRLLHAGAFNWTFTLGTGLMDPWSVGATALIPAEGVPLDALPLLLRRHDATIFAAAPGVYRKILSHHAKLDLPKLRHGLAAGEKLSDTIRQHWAEATGGKLIFEAYGMSECSTFISAGPANPALPGTLGRPQTGRKIAIVDEEGPVECGKDGTIAVHRSDQGLMLGYYGAPEDTAARFQGDWFLTGDHAEMSEAGDITFHGRVDDMMNAGGYRVSPLEVEAALLPHPRIREIGVTDIEIKEDAAIIAAFYTSDAEIPQEELTAYADSRLARYKQPRAWVRIDAMPTNPNGKLSRKALKPLFPRR